MWEGNDFMLQEFWNFLAAHKPTLILAFGWFIRELHNAWAFLQSNGGLVGLKDVVLHGKPEIKTQPQGTNESK